MDVLPVVWSQVRATRHNELSGMNIMTELLKKIRNGINRRRGEEDEYDNWMAEAVKGGFQPSPESTDKPDTLVVTSNGIKER